MGTKLKHISFSIDGPVDKFDYIEQLVKDHDITEYLISHEVVCEKNIPHYHFIILTNEKVYANFIKKLRNALDAYKKTTGRGGYSPYQRIKKPINDLHKLKVYCTKEGNIRSTYSTEVLTALHEESFMKGKDDQLKLDLIKYLDETFTVMGSCDIDLKKKLYLQIIGFLMDKELRISRPGIISWGNYYIANTKRYSYLTKKMTIYNLLF